MRQFTFGFIFAVFVVGFSSIPASASCSQGPSGELDFSRVSGQLMVEVCKSDVKRLVSEITQVGLCSEFPLQTDGTGIQQALNQCQNLLNQPIDLDLSIGSSTDVDAQAPSPGTYNFFYQLQPARAQYSALWNFSAPVTGGDGTQNVGAGQTGQWCYPAPFEYTTSTIFDGFRPNVCANTEPVSLPLSTLFYNNVGFIDWAGITSVMVAGGSPLDRQYVINPSAFQNVLLLDSELNLITQEANKNNTAYVLFVQKFAAPIQVSAGQKSMTFETTLTDKARMSISCPADLNIGCFINTPYTSVAVDLRVN